MSKTGTCKFFNDAKGYGFIVQSDGREDLFVHRNQLTDGQNLVDGDTVQYDEAWDERKGKSMAQNVTGGSGGASAGGNYGGGGFGDDSFGKGKGKGKKGGGACFTCGEVGHRAADCPQGGGGGSFGGFGKGGGKGYGGGGGGQACRQWQQGNCTFGDRCRFSHD
eukprot:TRINITY_DN59205_c0_g1_i1.p1 TRINITY_DN59205_c0_g1~~TRINITY_DN59205_c0_g1_i1.p1  ORF type:complete len:164 (+),score=46.12 TRINITY_DN59205_c0_g1_i1:116-607(+)